MHIKVLKIIILHAQCQTVLCKAFKSSRNEAINTLWKNTATSINIQYDQYKSTKGRFPFLEM